MVKARKNIPGHNVYILIEVDSSIFNCRKM